MRKEDLDQLKIDHKNGHTIQFRREGVGHEWRDTTSPIWLNSLKYRRKPQPLIPRKEYEDNNGNVYTYIGPDGNKEVFRNVAHKCRAELTENEMIHLGINQPKQKITLEVGETYTNTYTRDRSTYIGRYKGYYVFFSELINSPRLVSMEEVRSLGWGIQN